MVLNTSVTNACQAPNLFAKNTCNKLNLCPTYDFLNNNIGPKERRWLQRIQACLGQAISTNSRLHPGTLHTCNFKFKVALVGAITFHLIVMNVTSYLGSHQPNSVAFAIAMGKMVSTATWSRMFPVLWRSQPKWEIPNLNKGSRRTRATNTKRKCSSLIEIH